MDKAIRSLIHETTLQVWPSVPARLIEAQVLIESGGDPGAVSPAGAVGLLQLMPATAREMGLDPELRKDPAANLRAGVGYLKHQWDHLPEIGSGTDRLAFALAAYNGGRGYVNRALALAREACGAAHAGVPGPWQSWGVASGYLLDSRCMVNGRRPDAAQMIQYVARIRAAFWRLSQEG